MQVFVNLAPGQRLQAWVQNTGNGRPFESGTPVTVYMPRDALRVLPEGGTPVTVGAGIEEDA
jgi:hypothetical protein